MAFLFRRGSDVTEGDNDVVNAPSGDRATDNKEAISVETPSAQELNGNAANKQNDSADAAPSSDDVPPRASDVAKETLKSPGTPTFDEQAHQTIEETEIFVEESNLDSQNENGAVVE